MKLFAPDLPVSTRHYGCLVEFATPRELYHACEKVRDAGYTKWDAHSPFPVHGLDRAMGLKSSVLPWLVLGLALSGGSLIMLLMWWTSAVAYPLVISGKPYFSWQAFVPITFEVSVIFGAGGAVLGMFALNRLPALYHPLFHSRRFARSTDDRFFISVRADDPKYDEQDTLEFLRRMGAAAVEIVEN